MKKSKLIVPAALAVMLLSTAASVTGTVAWFTANRAVTIDASQFEVTTTDGNLAVSASNGINCTASGKTITVQTATFSAATIADETAFSAAGKLYTRSGTEGNYQYTLATAYDSETTYYSKAVSGPILTDASVNLQKGSATKVYNNGDVFDEHNYPTSYIETSANYLTDTTGVVLCVAWDLTFSYEFTANAASGSKVSLFFNVEDSRMAEIYSATLETGKGFRIGLSTASNAIVFADKQTQNNCNYVISGTSMAEPNVYTGTVNAPAYYANGDNKGKVQTEANYSTPYVLCGATSLEGATKAMLVDSTVGYNDSTVHTGNGAHLFAKATNGTLADHQKRGDYLGSFTNSSTAEDQLIVVKCFAWFEGTDPYIVNAEELNTMVASLDFYTRTSSVS